jgi:hypothetical protein
MTQERYVASTGLLKYLTLTVEWLNKLMHH